jgi:hypothetical protein
MEMCKAVHIRISQFELSDGCEPGQGSIGAIARQAEPEQSRHLSAESRWNLLAQVRFLLALAGNHRIANGPGLMRCKCKEKGSGKGIKKTQGEASSEKDKNARPRLSADCTRR